MRVLVELQGKVDGLIEAHAAELQRQKESHVKELRDVRASLKCVCQKHPNYFYYSRGYNPY